MSLRYQLNSGKNSKILYYLTTLVRYALPRWVFQRRLSAELRYFDKLSDEDQRYIMDRVEYYCKLSGDSPVGLSDSATTLGEHKLKNRSEERSKSAVGSGDVIRAGKYPSAYFHDTYEYIRYFDSSLRWEHLFGDIVTIPATPSIVKSRPLGGDNSNSVLLKLNKIRHFIRLNDNIEFEAKDSRALFRGDIKGKSVRREFIEKFIDHPLCDVGDVTPNSDAPIEWQREAISLYDHLRYKFIFALEGNDVASNLKWVMSSNSVAVMPKPTCETWFMEGRLRGGEHFIEIASDFSDVESQLQYYIDHPKEAIEITKNANEYTNQFFDHRREDLISLLVLQRYFEGTGQI